MIPTFEDALNELLDGYQHTSREDIISALELRLMALKEEQDEDADEDDGE